MTTEVIELPAGDFLALATLNPVALFTDDAQYSDFYAKVKAASLTGEPVDTETAKGRDEIKARAFKVTKAKTTLDKLALGLTEDWRTKTAAVNASRKKMVTELDALAAEVRAPVTAWEDAEKAREAKIAEGLAWLQRAGTIDICDTAETVADTLAKVQAFVVGVEYGTARPLADTARVRAIEALEAGLARLAREEADRAELEKLRSEKAAADERAAAEAQAKAEAAEAERFAKAAAERAAQAEAERLAQIERAAEKAKQDAERAAEAEKAAIAKAHADEIAKRDREAAYKENVRIEAEKAAAAAAAKIAADGAARAADRGHRGKIMGEAKAAIMSCDVSEAVAKAIVIAIVAGQIPHTAIRF